MSFQIYQKHDPWNKKLKFELRSFCPLKDIVKIMTVLVQNYSEFLFLIWNNIKWCFMFVLSEIIFPFSLWKLLQKESCWSFKKVLEISVLWKGKKWPIRKTLMMLLMNLLNNFNRIIWLPNPWKKERQNKNIIFLVNNSSKMFILCLTSIANFSLPWAYFLKITIFSMYFVKTYILI